MTIIKVIDWCVGGLRWYAIDVREVEHVNFLSILNLNLSKGKGGKIT